MEMQKQLFPGLKIAAPWGVLETQYVYVYAKKYEYAKEYVYAKEYYNKTVKYAC